MSKKDDHPLAEAGLSTHEGEMQGHEHRRKDTRDKKSSRKYGFKYEEYAEALR